MPRSWPHKTTLRAQRQRTSADMFPRCSSTPAVTCDFRSRGTSCLTIRRSGPERRSRKRAVQTLPRLDWQEFGLSSRTLSGRISTRPTWPCEAFAKAGRSRTLTRIVRHQERHPSGIPEKSRLEPQGGSLKISPRISMVGVTGFEPATPTSRTNRSGVANCCDAVLATVHGWTFVAPFKCICFERD
jgi:hypothetical protein